MDARFPPGMRAALDGEPASPLLAASIADDVLSLCPRGAHRAVLRAESLCAAVFAADGTQLHATSGWVAAALVANLDQLRSAPPGHPVAAAHMADAVAPLMIRANPAAARHWALPAGLAAALDLPGAAMLVLAVLPMAADAALAAAGRALRLTGQQSRVLAAVLKTGSIRAAAAVTGLAYITARGAVSDAMARVGVQRLPALLDRLTMLTLGVWPEDDGIDQAQIVADVLGLSLRQARLALALALGLTRAEAAAAIGISESVAKKDIDALFIITGVGSAPALVRRLAEVRVLAMLSGLAGSGTGTDKTGSANTGSDIIWADDGLSPLHFIQRPDGSRIALSDHGPAGAAPVLVLHSSMTTRHIAGPLLQNLHRAGYRVLAIDRPGFGLTDPVATGDPFAAAAADIETLLAALKLPRVAVVARGAAQVALAAARHLPGRLGPVVLVNPDPPFGFSGNGRGVMGTIKHLLWRNPAMVEGFARLLASQLTPGKAEAVFRRSVEASPPDRTFMADPRNVADYYRATRAFVTGRLSGFIAEQDAFATHGADAPLPGTHDWTVLLGESDMIHDPADAAAYWRRTLPDAYLHILPGAGRFLAMTHGNALISALSGVGEVIATDVT